MDDTARLALPYIAAQQGLKHITHNEALKALDVLVQAVVKSRAAATPPVTPAEGDCYIVASSGSGAWSGQDGRLASFADGAWRFYPAADGWRVYVADEAVMVAFDGSDWQVLETRNGAALPFLGIHTTADATNRLAVAAADVLFTHDGSDQRLKLNKASATDTGSVLFQTGFSGRAEFGLTGDDNWHVKTSPDGSAWAEAVLVSKDTGYVGIGGVTPTVPLEVAGNFKVDAIGNGAMVIGGDGFTTLDVRVYSDGGRPFFIGAKSRGTQASPGAVLSGDGIFVLSGRGWNGTGISNDASSIQFSVTENWSGTARGSQISLSTTANGTATLSERLRIGQDGSARFLNLATTASSANAFLNSADNNNLLRSTSSVRYKRDIEPLDPALSHALMAAQPIWYRSKAEADDPAHSWYGFAAEDVAKIDPRLVQWSFGADAYEETRVETPAADGVGAQTEVVRQLKPGAKKQPDGVAYDRFVVHHHVLIGELLARIEALETALGDRSGGH